MSSNLSSRKERARIILRVLKSSVPEAKMALDYSNDWEMLVAVVLSAQCTDKRVNIVTGELFKKYKTLDDYVQADLSEFEQDIKSTGFYRAKAKNVLAAAKMVSEVYGGKLPKTMKEMTAIPGVGRKTANILLGRAHGIIEGIAVDTHVKRLAKKFGLTTHTDAVKIERDLMEVLPKSEWLDFTTRIIDYGRQYSPAHKKTSDEDPISMALMKVQP